MTKNEEERVCVLQCRIPENAYGRLVRWTFCKTRRFETHRSTIIDRRSYWLLYLSNVLKCIYFTSTDLSRCIVNNTNKLTSVYSKVESKIPLFSDKTLIILLLSALTTTTMRG